MGAGVDEQLLVGVFAGRTLEAVGSGDEAGAGERGDVVEVDVLDREAPLVVAPAANERSELLKARRPVAARNDHIRRQQLIAAQIVSRETDDHVASEVVHEGVLLVVGRNHEIFWALVLREQVRNHVIERARVGGRERCGWRGTGRSVGFLLGAVGDLFA